MKTSSFLAKILTKTRNQAPGENVYSHSIDPLTSGFASEGLPPPGYHQFESFYVVQPWFYQFLSPHTLCYYANRSETRFPVSFVRFARCLCGPFVNRITLRIIFPFIRPFRKERHPHFRTRFYRLGVEGEERRGSAVRKRKSAFVPAIGIPSGSLNIHFQWQQLQTGEVEILGSGKDTIAHLICVRFMRIFLRHWIFTANIATESCLLDRLFVEQHIKLNVKTKLKMK